MKRILFVVAYLCLSLIANSQTQNPLKYKKLSETFPDSEVTLADSWIKEREKINTDYLRKFDPDRLLHNFRINAGLPSNAEPLGGWEAPWIGLRGHFVGHYLSAISAVIAKTGDKELKTKLDYLVEELSKCQSTNGYLSAFPSKDFDTLEQTGGGVWAPYYTYHKIMQGLLDASQKADNQNALKIASSMANYSYKRMKQLSDETIDKMLLTTEANPANEPGGMNDVLYQLYAVTKDARHLELAKIFDRDWFLKPLAEGKDILSGLHSNTHIPVVLGFAHAYEINNNQLYHDAVFNFWQILTQHHSYANGTSSGPRPNPTTQTAKTAEHWGEPDKLSNTLSSEIAESCVSHNTQRLTSILFQWTSQARFAEAYMNTYYNAVLALNNLHTGQVVYHLPLGSPRHKKWLNSNEDFRCCNGSSIEAFAALEKGIYYHDDNQIWVNLYIASQLDWREKGLIIRQEGDILRDNTSKLKIIKAAKVTINFFVPNSADDAQILLNGKQIAKPQSGTFCHINSKWRDGDEITIRFGYNFRTVSMPDNNQHLAIFYGPIMLAFVGENEIKLQSSPAEIVKNLSLIDRESLIFELKDGDNSYTLCPLFNITDENYSVYINCISEKD